MSIKRDESIIMAQKLCQEKDAELAMPTNMEELEQLVQITYTDLEHRSAWLGIAYHGYLDQHALYYYSNGDYILRHIPHYYMRKLLFIL